MLLFLLSLGWLAGIMAGSWSISPWLLGGLALGGLPLHMIRRRRFPFEATLVWLCLCSAFLGTMRYQHHDRALARDPFSDLDGQRIVRLLGVVDEEPEVSDVTARWALEVRGVKATADQEWQPQAGRILVSTRWLPSLAYGDEVEVEGKLQEPPSFENFDYRAYLRYQGIHRIMRYPKVTVVDQGRGNPLYAALYAVRRELARGLARALPEPQSALAQGILLGVRSAIPSSIEEDFRRTGATHILAISGHNLSVVAGLLAFVGAWIVGRGHPGYLTGLLLASWAYAALVGLSASVLRAAIMASFVYLALFLGRRVHLPLMLALSAALMTLENPFVIWDLGFQLSFLSLAGIVVIVPLLTRIGERLWPNALSTPAGAFGGILVGLPLAATFGATLATLPIQAINFGAVPFAALPTTVLALPALPGVLLGGFFSALAGLLAPPLAGIVSFPTWLSASYMLAVVHWHAQLPGASLEVAKIHPLWGWLYMLVLGSLVWAGHRWLRERLPRPEERSPNFQFYVLLSWRPSRSETLAWALAAILLVADLALLSATFRDPQQEVAVDFLDVQQGDAMLLQTAGGHRVLIDGGPSPSLLLAHLGERLPFWDRRIDLVVLTHPDRDHLTGLVEVLQRYPVGAVLEGPATSSTAEYAQWKQQVVERKIKRISAFAGTRLVIGDALVEVLHPPAGFIPVPRRGANQSSLVLKVVSYGHSLLLTGDIEVPEEIALLRQREKLAGAVLKIPHHGSKDASSAVFLEAVRPSVAVISAGAGNPYGHPTQEVLSRLAGLAVLRTDQDGTIELRLRPDGATLRGERPRNIPKP